MRATGALDNADYQPRYVTQEATAG
jgi:hypothetical protein